MKSAAFLVCLIVCTATSLSKPNVKAPQSPDNEDSVVSSLLTLIKSTPSLKEMLEKSGFSIDELDLMFGEGNLFGRLIQDIYKLSPVSGDIIDAAAKSNVELRIVLALARGETPSLIDLFKLATSKPENMFNSVDNAASENEYAQIILQKMKEPHPNITEIWNMITGKNLESGYILDNDKYAAGSTTGRKNRHLFELFQFIVRNWRPLEKVFRTMSNMPVNYWNVLRIFLGLDFSPIQFTLDNSPETIGDKYIVMENHEYVVSENGTFDPTVDEDILQVLQEIRVDYPSKIDVFEGPEGNDEARKAVFHLLEEAIEIFNRLLGTSDSEASSVET